MKTKKRVLWIEDQAMSMLSEYLAKVYSTGKYVIDVALNGTDGLNLIRNNIYDIVIIDIRNESGNDENWIKYFFKSAGDKRSARLGMVFLKLLFAPESLDTIIPGFTKPDWVKPEIFGVLTVESFSEVEKDLNEMGIKVYKRKSAAAGNSLLLEIIEEINRRNYYDTDIL